MVGFGPHLVALKAWEALGLSSILSELGMGPDRIAMAELMVVNRLVEPLSEEQCLGHIGASGGNFKVIFLEKIFLIKWKLRNYK